MILFSIIVGAIILSLFLLHWYQTRSRYAKLITKFPTIPFKPLIGHVIDLSTKPDVLYRQKQEILSGFKETMMGWGLYYGTIHIITADDAEILLSSIKHIDKGTVYDALLPWLGTGLLTSTGAKWQHRRKILTPTFHFNILRRFVEIFGDHCDNLITKLKKEQSKDSIINVVPLITDMTLGTICETAMGTKLNANDETQNKYLESLHSITSNILYRIMNPYLYSDIIFYYFSLSGWYVKNHIKNLHKFTRNVITERELTFSENDLNNALQEDEYNLTAKKRLAMLDLLISAKKKDNTIDNEGIREEVDTFMFEGHDTTSMAICFALMELAQHPQIQKKIINELDEIFGDDTRPATCDDLQNMKYLEMCIKECLRLYPSVPIIIRNINEDTAFTHHVAPAGTMAFIHIDFVHQDEKYYPDPKKFDPDRFLLENSKGRHPYAFIPFSAGPRNCIGQKYAMLELKSVISSIMRHFTLAPISNNNNIKRVIDLVLRVNGPILVKFIPRK